MQKKASENEKLGGGDKKSEEYKSGFMNSQNPIIESIDTTKVLAEKIKTSPQTASYERTLKLNLG